MTKIDYKPQLDYNNVLIRPKRSTLSSRNQVNLNRTFRFSDHKLMNSNSGNAKSVIPDWTGVPIIAANIANMIARATRSLITKYGKNGKVSFSASSCEVRLTSTPVGLLFPVVWKAQMCVTTNPSITNGSK